MFQVQLSLDLVGFASISIHKAPMKNGIKRQMENFVGQHTLQGEALQMLGKFYGLLCFLLRNVLKDIQVVKVA